MMRVASVGLGWWSDELARAIQNQSRHIGIVSCYSRSEDKLEAFAKEFGTRTHDSLQSILDDSDIDGVLLTTPHSLHAEHVMRAAASGKHVFVEKPLALTASSAFAAVDACREAGVTLAVGHNRRFSAAATWLHRQVQGRELGTIMHLESNFSAASAVSYTPDKWRASRVESPAGGIAGLGVHMIDLLCHLAGPIIKVRAQATRRVVSVDIDDTTSALFAFQSGATGYLGCCFASPYVTSFGIYGSKANAFANIDGNEVRLQAMGQAAPPRSLRPINTLKCELEAFARAALGEAAYPVKPEQAASNASVMEAIALAAKTGNCVEVDSRSVASWE